MSFPKYEHYKDSGVEWLGEVPAHWDIVPMKSVATCNDATLNENTPEDLEIEYIEISDVDPVRGITSSALMPFGEAPSRARRELIEGDVLVSTVRTYLRAIAPVTCRFKNSIASTGFAVIRPRSIDANYLGFLLQAEYIIALIISRSTGVSYPAINASDLMHLKIPVPSRKEQELVSEFLRREISKIDALITEQRTLIDLLKEKRQAVISHAVTKGLDPRVPMKDSGVEWLGEVPAHWKVLTIAQLSTKITNGYVGPTRDILVENGVPYIQATHIKNGKVNFDDMYFVRYEWSNLHAKSILKDKDVLIVQTGAGTGDVGLVTQSEVGFNCHALIIVSPASDFIDGGYLAATLQSSYGRAVLNSIQTGAMHPHLNCGNVKFVSIPVPSIIEQIEVVDRINLLALEFDNLKTEAETTIALLQERRSALISAAVTGKIDVRQAA